MLIKIVFPKSSTSDPHIWRTFRETVSCDCINTAFESLPNCQFVSMTRWFVYFSIFTIYFVLSYCPVLLAFFYHSFAFGVVKVCPHYAARHTAGKCGKAAWQKLRHATSISGCCIGLTVACRSMQHGLKIWSANCRSNQKKPRGIWWVRGFKMVSASLRKKSVQVRRSYSTVLVTWRCAKNYFFMWTRSHWRHMPSNFCCVAKLQCVAFCRTV